MALDIAETQALAITLAAHIIPTAPRTGQTPKEYLNAKRQEAAKNRRARSSSSSSRRRGTTTLECILLDAREGARELPAWLLQAASIAQAQDEPDDAGLGPSGQSRAVQDQEHLADDSIAQNSYLVLTSNSQDAARSQALCIGATQDSYEVARASSTMMTDTTEAAATAAAASIQPPLSPPATQPSQLARTQAAASPELRRPPAVPSPTKASPDLPTLFTQAITTSAVRINRLFRELHRQARRQDHLSMSTTATRQPSTSSMMASPPATALSSSAPQASTGHHDDAGFSLLQAIEAECDKLESTLQRVLSSIAAAAASKSSSTAPLPALPRCPKAEELLATCCRPIPPPSSSLSEDCFSGGLFGGMARDRVREVRGLLIRSTGGGRGGLGLETR